jgi:hypothetical protein
MPEWRFTMDQAFPAADEIARFVVGLGLINNEWHRTMKLMPKDDPLDVTDDERGIRLMLARQQAATCHEAIDFIANARHHYPKIGEFIDSLSDEAKEHYRQFNEAAEPQSPYYLPWLREHRHVTLHVPELHPDRYVHGKDAIANALAEAGPLEGAVFHEGSVASVRFGFADVVSVQMLPWDDPNVMKHLSRARLALGGFVHEAVEAYLLSLPHGVVRQVTH